MRGWWLQCIWEVLLLALLCVGLTEETLAETEVQAAESLTKEREGLEVEEEGVGVWVSPVEERLGCELWNFSAFLQKFPGIV